MDCLEKKRKMRKMINRLIESTIWSRYKKIVEKLGRLSKVYIINFNNYNFVN